MTKKRKPFKDSSESNSEYARRKEEYYQEASMPVRKTKEIAETHAKNKIVRPHGRPNPENEEGKELFDQVLKGMSKPEKD